ncbi:unnamed protein product [Durusdinium trenchii]|uniref:WGR domain-containing protein n=1 Tax=Durusdinium trenchii TaxID=1381693 RepID=A0ABP0HW72_9DINO
MPPKIPAWVAAKARAGAKAKAAARTSPKAKAKAKAKARAEKPAPAPKRKASGSSDAGKLRKSSSGDVGKAKAARKKGGGKKQVDDQVPGAGGYKVYQDYSVKLNQTNVKGNNNKYYIIQVLEGGGSYHAWNRWGRVGESGATKFTSFGSPDQAIKAFKSKFREKTCNAWEDADDFKPRKGKYIIVETEDAAGGGSAPMGKLTAAQIAKGQAVLDKIAAAMKKKGADLDDLSSQYFSLIPHDFGRKRPTSIKTQALLQEQQELLKFYLRMGFEEVESSAISPVEGLPVGRRWGRERQVQHQGKQ